MINPEWQMTLNCIARSARILPTTLDAILLGAVSCSVENAERLERVTGIGVAIWRNGSLDEIRAALVIRYPNVFCMVPA